MRYWDEDQPDWDEGDHDFAQAWRSKPKWVASRSLASVGPNATLVQGDLIDFAANLKSEPETYTSLARSLRTCCPLRVSLASSACTFVRTCSAPVNPTSLPPLRQMKLDAIGEGALRLTYVPA